MTQDNRAVPKLRKLSRYLKTHPELEQHFGDTGQYPEVCVLGALAIANGAQQNEPEEVAYQLLETTATEEFFKANDVDQTDFDTFAHFIDSCDDDTLADMLASLEETE